MKLFVFFLILLVTNSVFAQSPTPTPPDKRGLGIESASPTSNAQTSQQAREAKPELVLQTGYNTIWGATRLVFSPDGRLLATGTFRSNMIKLWETATNRKLRDLSSSGQTALSLSASFAFSRDSRLIAGSGGDNSLKVWDVMSGRERHSLTPSQATGLQGAMVAAIGTFFIGFASDNRLVAVSDVIRVWDLATGRELATFPQDASSLSGFNGTDGAITLSADGTQLLTLAENMSSEGRLLDHAAGREARRVKISDDPVESLQLSVNSDGQVLAAGLQKKRFKLWNLTTKKDHELGPVTKDFSLVKFSRDGRLLALSENYVVKLWDVATMRELPSLRVPNSGAFLEHGNAFMGFSEDGKRIATGGFDTDTIVWEVETGTRLSTVSGRTNMAYNVAFSTDGNELASGGMTRWDLRTGRGVRTAPATSEKTYGVASPDGRVLAA